MVMEGQNVQYIQYIKHRRDAGKNRAGAWNTISREKEFVAK